MWGRGFRCGRCGFRCRASSPRCLCRRGHTPFINPTLPVMLSAVALAGHSGPSAAQRAQHLDTLGRPVGARAPGYAASSTGSGPIRRSVEEWAVCNADQIPKGLQTSSALPPGGRGCHSHLGNISVGDGREGRPEQDPIFAAGSFFCPSAWNATLRSFRRGDRHPDQHDRTLERDLRASGGRPTQDPVTPSMHLADGKVSPTYLNESERVQAIHTWRQSLKSVLLTALENCRGSRSVATGSPRSVGAPGC